MQAALVIGLGVVLLVWWFITTRRHVDRRAGATAEWSEAAERPDLWTSSASCVHCGADGGLLELVGDRVQFECLSCGRRSVRETRG